MRIACSTKRRRGAAAVLAAAAGLACWPAAAQPAAVEPCQDPSAAAAGVYATFYDGMTALFPIDDSRTCEKLTDTLVTACHKAVSSAEKCLQQVQKSLFKDQKTACATKGAEQADCTDFYTNENNNALIAITAAAAEGNAACDLDEDQFWTICLNGFPAP